jgi:hypothetical protein
VNRSHLHRRLGLALVACLAIVGLSQCRFVNDSITGVDLKNNSTSLSARSECMDRCNDTFKTALEAEIERYNTAIRTCGNDKDCRDAERALHAAILDQLHLEKKNCKDSCYNEGGGQAGR